MYVLHFHPVQWRLTENRDFSALQSTLQINVAFSYIAHWAGHYFLQRLFRPSASIIFILIRSVELLLILYFCILLLLVARFF